MIRTGGYSKVPDRMLPDHLQQITLFTRATNNVSFCVAAAWKEPNGLKTKAISLGKYLTEADAALSAIGMLMEDLLPILSRVHHQRAEIVTESRSALATIQKTRYWPLPVITSIQRHTRRVEEEDGWVVLTWLPSSTDSEGYNIAHAAAQRAAKRQPGEIWSTSLSYVQQVVKQRWKRRKSINKHIRDARKSVTER